MSVLTTAVGWLPGFAVSQQASSLASDVTFGPPPPTQVGRRRPKTADPRSLLERSSISIPDLGEWRPLDTQQR